MTLTTEAVQLTPSTTWTMIDNTTDSYNIQNVGSTIMEYTFNDDVDFGGHKTVNSGFVGLTQPIYVRFAPRDYHLARVIITRVTNG